MSETVFIVSPFIVSSKTETVLPMGVGMVFQQQEPDELFRLTIFIVSCIIVFASVLFVPK